MEHYFKKDVVREVKNLWYPKRSELTRRTKVLIIFFKMLLFILIDIRDLLVNFLSVEFPSDPTETVSETQPIAESVNETQPIAESVNETQPIAESVKETPESWLNQEIENGTVWVDNGWYDFECFERGKVHGHSAALTVASEILDSQK